jgi:transmembrane sensor
VVLSATERHVDLTQGEAFFEVAKDPRRPFVVQAKGTRIIAVGTQFSVRREEGNQVQVLVTEGKVRIAAADSDAGSFAASPGVQPNLLTAGEAAHIGSDGLKVREEPAPQAEDALAWRDGYLVFRNTALSEAVAEFNRYSVHQIVVQDADMAAMPLTGKFRATNSDAFINLLEQTFHLQAQTASGEIVLSRGMNSSRALLEE